MTQIHYFGFTNESFSLDDNGKEKITKTRIVSSFWPITLYCSSPMEQNCFFNDVETRENYA